MGSPNSHIKLCSANTYLLDRPQNAEGKSSEAALAEATVRTIPQKRSAANSPPAQPPRQKKGPAASEPRRPLDATFVNSLRGYLSEHSGSELREIVLSLCLNKTGAYDSVRDRIKKMEAQKNVTIPFSQGGLGLHLQYLRTSELESLILHICDVDRSDFTKELLKQLLLVMQQRKASGRNTT
ncbi:hypothetical protein F4818DRAFT_410898 [Hypoxylon cercidicola]|nr:hypothetical protein F4818DRAFT_410898 [Hypoxylon cercidicola]